jgi:anti-anti-sigma factor
LLPSSARIAVGGSSSLTTPELRAEGSTTVLVLRGEADLAARALVSDALSRVIGSHTGDVVVDLAEVEFIDTAIVRVLADAQRFLDHHGRALTIRSPSRLATRVLNLFGLTDLVEPITDPAS